MTKPLKFGYEGEGPMIGRKTVYASYPDPDVAVYDVVAAAVQANIDSIYIVIDDKPEEFVSSLRESGYAQMEVVTLDYPVENYRHLDRFMSAIHFLRCTPTTRLDDIPRGVYSNLYIKMVCDCFQDFWPYVHKANDIAALGHTVLLMPDFWTTNPCDLGAKMMEAFNILHPKVRVMPPVHHVLGMP